MICFRSLLSLLLTGSGVTQRLVLKCEEIIPVRVFALVAQLGVGVRGRESVSVYRRKNSSGTCSGMSACFSGLRFEKEFPSAA